MNKYLVGIALFIIVVFGATYAFYASPVIAPALQTVTYVNASDDLIVVTSPMPGAKISRTVTLEGKARGTWYFEASFPVAIIGIDGSTLFEGPITANGDWMTEDFVPFKTDVTIPGSYTGRATVIFKKDNPSGEPTRDASASVVVTIE